MLIIVSYPRAHRVQVTQAGLEPILTWCLSLSSCHHTTLLFGKKVMDMLYQITSYTKLLHVVSWAYT